MSKTNYFSLFFLVTLLLTAFRVYFLKHLNLELYADEAQYWYWSKHLDFGYYSKPPMIAYLIHLTTSIFGDGEFGIRVGSTIVHAINASIIYALCKVYFSRDEKASKIAFFSALSYLLTPGIFFSSVFASTDPLLITFWSLSLLFFTLWLNNFKFIYTLALGVCLGFGMLSKYSMAFFPIAMVFYFMFAYSEKTKLGKTINWFIHLPVVIIIAFLVFSPNLMWNLQHNMATIKHTQDISHVGKDLFHLDVFSSFFLQQFIIFGPVFFLILLYLLLKKSSYKHLFSYFSTVPLLIISFLAIVFGGAYANWAVTAYVGGVIIVCAVLVQSNAYKTLAFAILINFILGVGVLLAPDYHKDFKIPSINKYMKRFSGSKELAMYTGAYMTLYPDTLLLADDRKLLANLLYYGRNDIKGARKISYFSGVNDHFDLTMPLTVRDTGKNFIYITKLKENQVNHVLQKFESYIYLRKLTTKGEYNLYHLEHYKGR